MYYGMGKAVAAPARAGVLWTPLPVLGAAFILAGAVLVAWTMRVFRSWRFQARIEAGHKLSTDGPFAFVRHPIYAALDLLALGSLIWIPTPGTAAGLLLMMVMGDLRARGEERVLLGAFGEDYRRYGARVRRFLPGLY